MLLYDNFEIQRVGEFDGDNGEILVEPIFDDGVCDDTYRRVYWTVYGHKPEGGVEALADRDRAEDAAEVYDYFMMLLRFFKKAHGV